jgi:RND family efflux transporter MFP subunit
MNRLALFTNMSKKKIYIGCAVVALICILAGVFWNGRNQAAPVSQAAALVRAVQIGAVGANPNYTYAGEVRGRYESQLAFQVGGKIIKRYIDLGKRVQAGEPLMQLDPKDVQQTVNISSAQVYSADSQLKLAESNLARYRKLYEQNAISHMQYEQVLNAYDAAVAVARQASAQYVQGANQLDYTTLYADGDGVIASIDAEAGQVVGAGQNVVTLVKDGELEVEISVPENRIEEVRKAGLVNVSFWALPSVKVDGKIREISPMADKVTRTYKVRISLLKTLPEIKLGMTATVAVAGNGQQSAVYIPLSAVYQDKESPSVWVINGDAVSLRPVILGAFGDKTVQVLAGLNNGETIVTAGVHKLREGQKVRIAGDGL